MANERFAIHCPVCKKSEFFAKSFGSAVRFGGWIAGSDTSRVTIIGRTHTVELIERFMFDHLMSCHGGQVEQPDGGLVFEIIPEAHSEYFNREKL